MIQFPSLQLWGPQSLSVLPFLLLGATQKTEHSGLRLALRALMKDPYVSSPLFSASVMMRMAHGSCSPAIRETILNPQPLSPEYEVCMLREEEGRIWWGGGGGAHPPSCCPKRGACPSPPAPPVAPYRPPPHAALSCSGAPFDSSPCHPQPLSLTSLAARLKVPLGSPPSFGQWYRGEAEAPGTETSSVAPSQLQGGEETLQPPHLEPVGSPTAPDS